MVALADYRPGTPFVYYFGTAWSKYDVPSMAQWQHLLRQYAANLKAPLQVSVK